MNKNGGKLSPNQSRILKIIKNISVIAALGLAIYLCIRYRVFTVDSILNRAPKNQALAIVFMLFVYCLNTLSFVFPIAVIYIAGGMLFPLPIALLINFIGASLCTFLPYIFCWYKGADALNKRLSKYKIAQEIFELEKGNELFLSYFLRVINLLPMDLVSMYLGARHIDPAKYIIGSMLGNMPGIIAITIVGSSITDPTSPTFIISLCASLLISIVSFIVYRSYKKRKLNNREK